MVAVLGEIAEDSPSVTVNVDSLAAGQTATLQIQLPVTVMALGPQGEEATAFDTMVVAIDSFDELLDKKESIAPFVLQQVKEKAAALGVAVNGFGIRDIILPGDVKEIMNQVLVAEKKAQANTIMRREETASTRSLLNTARLMEDNAMLWKLKEMEYVEKIADKINSISVGGNGKLLEQLKDIFAPK